MNKIDKLYFDCDYMEGAHENILKKLVKINLEKNVGYGFDKYSKSAADKIRKECELGEEAQVFFMTGGTQANTTIIDALSRSHEGVLTSEYGHINVHESGAVEAYGHKVLTLPSTQGKISAETVSSYLEKFNMDVTLDHMVYPGMLYLTFPTEFGTVYSLKELKDLRKVCDDYDMPMYMDGARLGYGLAAPNNDVTLKDIAQLFDAFYIGGTKVGALIGEAAVFPRPTKVRSYLTHIKCHGGLLAKGWIPAVCFDELFTNGLYFQIAKHAVDLALQIKEALNNKGYRKYMDSTTNQQFAIVDNKKRNELAKKVSFDLWEPYDKDHTIIRFATSWATNQEDVDKLISLL
ncbi:MAG: beta-eliminating lyase-related protein [Bacteroidales bacterium]